MNTDLPPRSATLTHGLSRQAQIDRARPSWFGLPKALFKEFAVSATLAPGQDFNSNGFHHLAVRAREPVDASLRASRGRPAGRPLAMGRAQHHRGAGSGPSPGGRHCRCARARTCSRRAPRRSAAAAQAHGFADHANRHGADVAPQRDGARHTRAAGARCAQCAGVGGTRSTEQIGACKVACDAGGEGNTAAVAGHTTALAAASSVGIAAAPDAGPGHG